MTANNDPTSPSTSTRSALGSSDGSDVVRIDDAQSRRRRFCLLCQGAGGWPVAVLLCGQWVQQWKLCHACEPTSGVTAKKIANGSALASLKG
jgi:hypothetical protein